MLSFIGPVAALVAVAALTAGAVSHLLAPSVLPTALRAQGVLPDRLVPTAAVAVPVAELAIAGFAAQALLRGRPVEASIALALGAALFAGYAAYALWVRSKRNDAPCGCSRADVPMNGWVATRAGAFALCAATGAATAHLVGPDAAETAVVLLAAATLAILLWHLPAAMGPTTDGRTPRWTS